MNTTPAPIADQIAPLLPYLRRFSRALCGSQERGDTYVVATLEALIADNSLFDRRVSPTVATYKSFLKVWNSLPMNSDEKREVWAPGSIADRRLEQITPLPRQAFLLTALEEFKTSDVATILGKPESEVEELVNAAGREISEQLAARVLIIEDEPLIALDIETLISEIGHECVGVATTRGEARNLARSSKPGIILSDIQLADGSSGIDAVNDILTEMDVPVIFITAYPERLLTGERAEPTFLITKPFQPSMVKAIVSQALFFDMKAKGGAAKSR